MASEIYITGLEELEKNVNQLIKASTEAEVKVLKEAADFIKAGIKEKAPIGPTGNLRAAVYSVAYPATLQNEAVAYAGIRPRKAPHAHLVEYGHGGPQPAPPHPFFRQAVDPRMEKAEQMIAEGLGKAIEGAV